MATRDRSGRITAESSPEQLTIRYRWFTPGVLAFIALSAIGIGGLVFWLIQLPELWNFFDRYMGQPVQGVLFLGLASGVFLAMGVGIPYFTITGLFNHTVISVACDRITVRHAPFPWRGNKSVDRSAVAGLSTVEVIGRGTVVTSTGMFMHPPLKTYEVHALLGDGSTVTIIGGLDFPDMALFIEREMESWLGLKELAVSDV